MRSPKIEAMLDKRMVDWIYEETFDLSDVKVGESLKNQARTTPLDDEYVAALVRNVTDSRDYDAIIVTSDGVIIDGNHRYAALTQMSISHHDAYVIDAGASVSEVRFITYAANNVLNGRRNTVAEQVAHAVWLHQVQGLSATEAAAVTEVHPATVSKHAAANEVKDELLQRHGKKAVSALSLALASRLKNASTEAQDAVVNGIKAGLTNDRILSAVNAIVTSEKPNQVVTDLVQSEGKPVRSSASPSSRLRMAQGYIRGVLTNPPPSYALPEVKREALQVRTLINRLLRELGS